MGKKSTFVVGNYSTDELLYQPVEIKIVKNDPTNPDSLDHPFNVYINGKEISNLQKISLDLDMTKDYENLKFNIQYAIPAFGYVVGSSAMKKEYDKMSKQK